MKNNESKILRKEFLAHIDKALVIIADLRCVRFELDMYYEVLYGNLEEYPEGKIVPYAYSQSVKRLTAHIDALREEIDQLHSAYRALPQ